MLSQKKKVGDKIMALTKTEVARLNSLILKADANQLSEAVEVFKMARSKNSMEAKASLRVGMAVEWVGKRGRMNGVIEKINRKNVVVDAGYNGRWNIPASMLKEQETVTMKGI
jgi:uncharacterized protein YkvS